MLKYLRSLFRVLKSRDRFEQDMGEELRFHIAEYTDELVRSGVTPQEAARRARIEFGSVVTVQEDCREARGLYLVDELVRQIRHAYRLLRKTPKFARRRRWRLWRFAWMPDTYDFCGGGCDSFLRPLPFPEAGDWSRFLIRIPRRASIGMVLRSQIITSAVGKLRRSDPCLFIVLVRR